MLHHVALEVAPGELERSLEFWRFLGFEETEPPESLRERARWVERDGTQIHLLFAEEPTVPPAGHPAVVAPDFDGTVARLRAAGYEVEARPAHWGAARARATAPGGHRVELMAAPPPRSR